MEPKTSSDSDANIPLTRTPADNSEFRKRQLSENSESTGVSPDTKKPVMCSRIKLKMPADDASPVDWFKVLFKQMEDMYDQYDELKQTIEFSSQELVECKSAISCMKKEIHDLKGQVVSLESENQEIKMRCSHLNENNLKTETHLREQNLVFEGIAETYGEDQGLLSNKIFQTFNHMMVPISKIHRVGPFLKGQCRPVVCHFVRYSDVQLLLKNRSQLPDNVFIREDFPPEIDIR